MLELGLTPRITVPSLPSYLFQTAHPLIGVLYFPCPCENSTSFTFPFPRSGLVFSYSLISLEISVQTLRWEVLGGVEKSVFLRREGQQCKRRRNVSRKSGEVTLNLWAAGKRTVVSACELAPA